MKTTHTHHVVPRHAGGDNSPSNLVELTVEEHAQAHWDLFVMYGREEDEIAYLGLSKMIGHEEAHRMAAELGSRRGTETQRALQKDPVWVAEQEAQTVQRKLLTRGRVLTQANCRLIMYIRGQEQARISRIRKAAADAITGYFNPPAMTYYQVLDIRTFTGPARVLAAKYDTSEATIKAIRTGVSRYEDYNIPVQAKRRLDGETVAAIRAETGSSTEIAKRYGVGSTTISKIRGGVTHRQT